MEEEEEEDGSVCRTHQRQVLNTREKMAVRSCAAAAAPSPSAAEEMDARSAVPPNLAKPSTPESTTSLASFVCFCFVRCSAYLLRMCFFFSR